MSTPSRVTLPFSGGKVTAQPEDMLRVTETAEMENAILVNGAAQERNGYAPFGADDPFGGDGLTSGRAWVDDSFSLNAERLAFTATEKVGVVDQGGSNIDVAAVTAFGVVSSTGPYLIEDYAGEVILAFEGVFSRGTVEPLRRWAGVADDALTNPAGGTFTTQSGVARAAGSASNFDGDVAVNSYLFNLWRVAKVFSDTEIGLANTPDFASTFAVSPTATAVFGLKTLVTRMGVTSHGSSSTTITGKGTAWNSSNVPGNGRVQVGDIVLKEEGHSINDAMVVTAVGGDGSLTVESNSVAAWTDEPAVILRPLVGECMAIHRGRPFAAGVSWAGDRLQILPQGYDLGAVTNGLYSPINDGARAAEVESVEIPNPTSTGRITGLASHEAGLVIVKWNDTYLGRGEWPGMSFDRLGEFGSINRGGTLAARGAVFIAGAQGVWQFDGSLRELSAPRQSEWKALVGSDSLRRTQVGYADDHLFVVAGSANSNEARMWVYDLERRVWVGDMTNDDATGIPQIDSMRFLYSRSRTTGDSLLGYTGSTASGERTAVDLATAVRVNDAGETTIHTGRGRFMGVVPPSAAGAPSRRKRLVGVKVSYTLDADSGTLDLAAAVDNSTFTAEKSMAGNVADGADLPLARRALPDGGNLGVSGRNHRVRLQRSAGATNVRRLVVHEVEVNVREGRVRA